MIPSSESLYLDIVPTSLNHLELSACQKELGPISPFSASTFTWNLLRHKYLRCANKACLSSSNKPKHTKCKTYRWWKTTPWENQVSWETDVPYHMGSIATKKKPCLNMNTTGEKSGATEPMFEVQQVSSTKTVQSLGHWHSFFLWFIHFCYLRDSGTFSLNK